MGRKNYHQACGLARALDIVGERWTLLIVRNLLLGPLRYSDLLRGLPGMTTNLLAQRLKELESAGVIERVREVAGGGHSYRLTELGSGLEPAIHALGAWGWNWMGQVGRKDRRSFEWLLVALRRRYLGGRSMVAELVADEVAYRFDLTREHARITRGSSPNATLRVRGPGQVLAGMFLNGIDDRSALPAGVEVSDAEAFGDLVGSFRRGDGETRAAGVPGKRRRVKSR